MLSKPICPHYVIRIMNIQQFATPVVCTKLTYNVNVRITGTIIMDLRNFT